MKIFIAILIASPLVLGDFYSSRYDDFDIQPILENDRILLGYTKCFLDQGPCTPEAKDFKSKFFLHHSNYYNSNTIKVHK